MTVSRLLGARVALFNATNLRRGASDLCWWGTTAAHTVFQRSLLRGSSTRGFFLETIPTAENTRQLRALWLCCIMCLEPTYRCSWMNESLRPALVSSPSLPLSQARVMLTKENENACFKRTILWLTFRNNPSVCLVSWMVRSRCRTSSGFTDVSPLLMRIISVGWWTVTEDNMDNSCIYVWDQSAQWLSWRLWNTPSSVVRTGLFKCSRSHIRDVFLPFWAIDPPWSLSLKQLTVCCCWNKVLPSNVL